MDDYIGLINIYSGPVSRIPKNYALCDGSILTITQYQALFSILGSRYGGDGKTTFALPDLRGRVPIGALVGAAPNPKYPDVSVTLGGNGGSNTVVLQQNQVPGHTHITGAVIGSNVNGASPNPQGGVFATASAIDPNGETIVYLPYTNTPAVNTLVNMSASAVTVQPVGGTAHENMMPYVGINYIICMIGLYPPHDN